MFLFLVFFAFLVLLDVLCLLFFPPLSNLLLTTIVVLVSEISLNKSPENIFNIGLSEVKRIRELIREIMQQKSKYKRLTDFFKHMNNKKFIYNNSGIDEIEFYISTNLGEDPKPLAKIASGGEISRIMLALKTILAKWFEERVIYKNEMKKAYKSGNPKLGEQMHLKQHTMKILLNSLYGATALGSFRYGNVILSESITLTGQRIIQESALFANTHMNKVLKGEIQL